MSKAILITGAGSGFGKGTALGLAKNGHTIIATVQIWPQASELMAAAEAEGVELEVAKLDLLDPDDHEAIFRKYGDRIDILVNNAATGETGPLAEVPVDRVRREFDVNVFAPLEFTQPFARRFVEKGKGKIVFTSSIAGFTTFPFLGPYVASKHALEGVVQMLQQELEGTGVQVATINPGPFRTGFNDRMYDTLDQWYDPARNFTAEEPIRDAQGLFEGDELQLDPKDMIDFMVDVIPQDHHKFRNVFPERFIEDVKNYQASLWTKEV
ncbi:MAG: SDR family oxidoreductase [Myxococcota bacterium]|nr:SDR family oxidoreductase [Myxococcota bacterium]